MVRPMRMRTAVGVVSLVLAAPAAFAVAGDAAVTTIGPQNLTSGTENAMSYGTYIQYSGSAPAYVSPVEGTIVKWRVASGSGGAVRLRVLRPAGGGKFTGAGTSALEMSDDSVDTFTTSLPIKAGDAIGVDNESAALLFTTGVPGAFSEQFVPALADGAPAAEPQLVKGPGGATDLELQINADVQPTANGGGSGGGGGSGSGGAGGSPSSGNAGNGGAAPAQSPTLASLKLVPSAFTAATSGGSIGGKRNRGTTVSYSDSQAATATFVVLQKRSGRRSKAGACVTPARSPHGRPCTQSVTIGSFTHADNSGADSFHFSGRVHGRTLRPGSYELQGVARDAAGLASRAVVSGFRVKA